MLALAAVLAPGAPAGGQSVLGAAESAFVPPRGVFRMGLDQRWADYDATFGAPGAQGDTSVALGARFSGEGLGAAQLTTLAPVERDLRQLAGQGGLALSLGRTVVSTSASRRVTAVELEAGLGAGLSIGVVVPVVRTLSSVAVTANAEGGAANVGLNPARYGGAVGTARAANGAVKSQFDAAAARLRTQYGSCFTATGAPTGAAGCTEVVALYAAATDYATALARTYGTAQQGGAPVVPLAGSAAQRAVDATVASYNARFAALFGTPAGPITGALRGAVPATDADFQSLLTDPEGGYALDSLRSARRLSLGDVEVGVRLRVIDTFRGREERRLAPVGVNFRTTVAGTFRFGTGQVDSPDDLTDLATGDGQNDVEVASLTDLVFGARAWLTVAARYGRQLADEQRLRIPYAGAGAYLPAFTAQPVARDLGDYLQFEATPRVAVSRAFALEAQYRYRSKQADRYTGTFTVADSAAGATPLTLDAAELGVESEQREQRVGGAVTYSTYAAHGRRRARLPLEVSLGYLRTIAGEGGVPDGGTVQLQLRAFPRLFGRDWRAPRAAAAP